MNPTIPNQLLGSVSPIRGQRGSVRLSGAIGEGSGLAGGDDTTKGTGNSFLSTLGVALGAGLRATTGGDAGAATPEGGPGLQPAILPMEMPAPATSQTGVLDFTDGPQQLVQPGQIAEAKTLANVRVHKGQDGSETTGEVPEGFGMSGHDGPAGQQAEIQPITLPPFLCSAGREVTKSHTGGAADFPEIPSVGHPELTTPADLAQALDDAPLSSTQAVLPAPAIQTAGPSPALRASIPSPSIGGRLRAEPFADTTVAPSGPSSLVTTPDIGWAQANDAMAIPAPASRTREMAPASTMVQGLASPSLYPQISPALVSLAAGSAGTQRLTLRLDPVELGLVEIRIERIPNAPPEVSITANRPETLLLLQRDHHQLQKALDQAGIPAEGRLVTFQSGTLHLGAMGSKLEGQSVAGQPHTGQSPSDKLLSGQTFDPGSDADGSRRGWFPRDGGCAEAEPSDTGKVADDGGSATAALLMIGSRWLRAGMDIVA